MLAVVGKTGRRRATVFFVGAHLKRKYLSLIISIILTTSVAFLVACSEVRERSYTIEIVDGVPHVHNIAPQSKDRRIFTLEYVQSIGGLNEADENFQFSNAIDAAIDEQDNIYILDSGNYRVQVFDSAGVYQRTIGRKGQGPGDLQNGFSLDLAGNGDVVVLDRIKRSLERFDSLGRFIKSVRLSRDYSYFRLTEPESFCAPLVEVVFPKYVGLMISPGFGRKPSEGLLCAASIDLTDGTTREFCPGIPEDADHTFGSQINASVLEVDSSRQIYVAFKYQNRIDKFAPDGRLQLTIKRPLGFPIVYKPVERLWMSGSIGRKFQEFGGTLVSERLGIDGGGRIWVVTYTDQPLKDDKLSRIKPGGKVFDVFTPDGILLTRVPFPDARLVFLRMRGDRLLFTDEDYLTILQYRIRES
jgi:hypothetical protein